MGLYVWRWAYLEGCVVVCGVGWGMGHDNASQSSIILDNQKRSIAKLDVHGRNPLST